MKRNAIIIDDEPMVRQDLKEMLNAHPEIRVVCESGTISEAREQLLTRDLDVVFLDVQLRGGTGFDLVPFIHPRLEIIFVTAFDEYAIRAFEINALDYLLKPVNRDRLCRSIRRLLNQTAGADRNGFGNTADSLRPDDRILIHSDDDRRFVSPNDITLITSIGGNYIVVSLNDGTRLTCRQTLKEWERILSTAGFARVHHATIVNLDRIRRIESLPGGACRLYLSRRKDPVEVSRRKSRLLKDQLSQKTGHLSHRG